MDKFSEPRGLQMSKVKRAARYFQSIIANWVSPWQMHMAGPEAAR